MANTPSPSATINWRQIQRDYAALLYTAAHAFTSALGCTIAQLDQRAVQAAAYSILGKLEAQGHRLGTLSPKPVVKPPTKEELAEVPEALAQTDDDLPF